MGSQNYQTTYQPLLADMDDNEHDDPEAVNFMHLSPDTQSSMLFHVVPQSSQSRWNHMEDLDSFFTRVYHYHQNNGFLCMVLQQAFELAQFIFVLVFSIFLVTCVDYDVLFRNRMPASHNASSLNHTDKITIADTILSRSQCAENITWPVVFIIVLASIFWLLRFVHAIVSTFRYWEIKQFFNSALGILDVELDNTTWDEVQQRVMEVQVEQRMCIHKEVLTELDIYHRILRFNNYFLAMINKNVIPLRFEVPLFGEVVFLTKGLRYNIEMLLFWGPWAPFQNNWHLSDEYKRLENRHELADKLSKYIFLVGLANLALFPFVLLFQILYSFFYYAEIIKREPGSLGSRRWSHFGKAYLRHFNELDHELKARLNRGYRAATQYMNIFSSPILAVISQHFAFLCGSILAVLAALSIYDEDVLQVEHVLTLMTILGAFLAACRVFIPEEHLVFCPEFLLAKLLAEVHYLPDHWRGKAHTSRTRQEFSQLFQYRVVHIFEELMSPIITPLVLMFRLQYRSLEIVDFLRNFTVEVVGVGDVCSFAQMDIRHHGCPTWHPEAQPETDQPDANDVMPTEGGKTELSLLHFTITNPKWQPPQESTAFLTALKNHAQRDMNALPTLPEENALCTSLNTLSLGGPINWAVNSMMRAPYTAAGYPTEYGMPGQSFLSPRSLRCGLSHLEGSRHGSNRGIFTSVTQQQMGNSSLGAAIGTSSINSGPIIDPVLAPSIGGASLMSPMTPGLPQDLTAIDMNLSTLYLHELHRRNQFRATYLDRPSTEAFRSTHSFQVGGAVNVAFAEMNSGAEMNERTALINPT